MWDDARLKDVVSLWLSFQGGLYVVPAPVDKNKTCAHHNQDLVVLPEPMQTHDDRATNISQHDD